MVIKMKLGDVFEKDAMLFAISRIEDGHHVIAENLISGETIRVALKDIDTILPAAGGAGSSFDSLIHSDGTDTAVLAELMKRSAAIRPLFGLKDRKANDVKKVADDLRVSSSTIYRWLSQLEATGKASSWLRKSRSDIGKSRLSAESEQLIQEVIRKHWQTSQKKNISEVYRELKKDCRKQQLKAPSLSTLRTRIDQLDRYESKRRREGHVAALSSRLSEGSIQNVDYPYAVIQIDHTRVDVELVDSNDRQPIGRPWITVAIDVKSRMTVGWYISFDPPGALSTGLTIVNLVLPKKPQMADMGVDYEWLCQGFPGVIHVDNAREFRGRMLELACKDYLFDIKFRKRKHPQYGAHIERLQGTLMSRIHALEGTTFSNPKQRGDYKSSEKAILTLAEFEQWFAHLVLGGYHHEPHEGLDGRAPVDVYREAILGSKDVAGIGMPATPVDEERFRLDFLPPLLRTIQADGVEIDKINYSQVVLKRWIGRKNPAPVSPDKPNHFVFRRDPRNISKIFFYDPELKRYFSIPYARKTRKAMSLWRLNEIRSRLKVQGMKEAEINEETLFRAMDAMDGIVAQAKRATRTVRKEMERKIKHAASPAASAAVANLERKQEVDDEEDKSTFVGDIRPFTEVRN